MTTNAEIYAEMERCRADVDAGLGTALGAIRSLLPPVPAQIVTCEARLLTARAALAALPRINSRRRADRVHAAMQAAVEASSAATAALSACVAALDGTAAAAFRAALAHERPDADLRLFSRIPAGGDAAPADVPDADPERPQGGGALHTRK